MDRLNVVVSVAVLVAVIDGVPPVNDVAVALGDAEKTEAEEVAEMLPDRVRELVCVVLVEGLRVAEGHDVAEGEPVTDEVQVGVPDAVTVAERVWDAVLEEL